MEGKKQITSLCLLKVKRHKARVWKLSLLHGPQQFIASADETPPNFTHPTHSPPQNKNKTPGNRKQPEFFPSAPPCGTFPSFAARRAIKPALRDFARFPIVNKLRWDENPPSSPHYLFTTLLGESPRTPLPRLPQEAPRSRPGSLAAQVGAPTFPKTPRLDTRTPRPSTPSRQAFARQAFSPSPS